MTTINTIGLGLSGASGTGSVVGSVSPTLTTPRMNTINTSAGREVLALLAQGSSVNYLSITATNTGSDVIVQVSGTDANRGMNFLAKNSGLFTFYTTATPQISITGGSGTNLLAFPQNTNTNTYTFQDVTGVPVMDTSGSGLGSGSITTIPPDSSTSAMTIGSYQNPEYYDVMLILYLNVTASTADTISLSVSSGGGGTASNIITNLTVSSSTIIPIPIYIPARYIAILSVGGSVTATVSGQIQIPI